jgi:hypothetical protein
MPLSPSCGDIRDHAVDAGLEALADVRAEAHDELGRL